MMLLFADLHLNEDSAEVCLGEILPGIRQEAVARGITQIAFLGDFWDIRYRVVVKLLNAVRDELRHWHKSGLELRVLPGNHDQIDVAGRNALEVFSELPGVRVYNDPVADHDGVWIPYRKRREDLESALSLYRKLGTNPQGKRVLFSHHGVQGAFQNDHRKDTDGLPLTFFLGFDRILMGHYHKRQILGSIIYVGSPRQVTAHEAGQPKGFALWDGKQIEWVDKDWGPRFHKARAEGADGIDLSGVQPGDDVRVTAAPGVDQEALIKALDATGARYVIEPEEPKSEARIDVPEGAGLRDFALGYVELHRGELDAGELMGAYDALVGAVV